MGERALRGAQDDRGDPERRRDAHADRRPGRDQPRNARGDPGHRGPQGCPSAHPHRGPGARRPAGAPDRARGRLCGHRDGPGLPPLRQPRDDHRAGAQLIGREDATSQTRCGASWRAKASKSWSGPIRSACRATPARRSAVTVRTAAGEREIEGSDILVAAGRAPTPPVSASRRPASSWTPAATSASTSGWRRAPPMSGPSGNAPAARSSRTSPSTTSGSSGTMAGGAAAHATGWSPTSCSRTRRSPASD